jgi:hypothetical protein
VLPLSDQTNNGKIRVPCPDECTAQPITIYEFRLGIIQDKIETWRFKCDKWSLYAVNATSVPVSRWQRVTEFGIINYVLPTSLTRAIISKMSAPNTQALCNVSKFPNFAHAIVLTCRGRQLCRQRPKSGTHDFCGKNCASKAATLCAVSFRARLIF